MCKAGLLSTSESGFTLRTFADADLEAMFALDRRCFQEPFRFSRAAIRGFAKAANADVVLVGVGAGAGDGARDTAGAGAGGGDQLAGFVIIHREFRAGDSMGAEFGYVVTLDVAPEWRGTGVAGALMREAEARQARAGIEAMRLHVSVENAVAIRFYERCGYLRLGLVVGFYGAGGDALLYRKGLGASSQG